MNAPLRLLALSCLLFLTACVEAEVTAPEDEAGLAPLYLAAADVAIPGSYIVVYKEGAEAGPGALAMGATRVYASALDGFAGTLSDAQVDALRRDPNVAFIEEDQRVSALGVQVLPTTGGLWGLDRIDQRPTTALNRRYRYASTGAGVTAYIIDSGIEATHPEFLDSLGAPRALSVFDGLGGSGVDCAGHGTHVAGTVGGLTFGVAKDVQIRTLRVLDCAGSGAYSATVAALDWVYANGVSPSVVNLSLGGGWSKAAHLALDSLVASGTFVVVAAGNSGDGSSGNGYTCSVSLGGAVEAYAVGAVDSTLTRSYVPFWWGSNWGQCISLYAPGSYVLSSMIGNTTAIYSGTSMAAPHVTGAVARYLQKYPDATPTQIRNYLNNVSTKDAITGLDPGVTQYGSPNRFLFIAPAI